MKVQLCHRVTFASPHIQPQKDAFCCCDAGESPVSPDERANFKNESKISMCVIQT